MIEGHILHEFGNLPIGGVNRLRVENDMDSQIVESAIKRCVDISTRLGALKDEVLPLPAASSSSS